MLCAGIAIITQITLLGNRESLGIAGFGAGLWTGLFFGVTGLIGLFASQKPSKCNLSAFLTLSIISALLCLPLIVFASIGLLVNWSSNIHYDYGYYLRRA